MGKRRIVVIPAKGKSERLTNKNMRPLADRPLLYWALKRAVGSALGDVWVDTDSEWVADYVSTLSKPLSANINIRPEGLRGPNIRLPLVIEGLLRRLKRYDWNYDTLVVTLPSSPFCTVGDLRTACRQYDVLKKPVLSVSPHWGDPLLFFYQEKEELKYLFNRKKSPILLGLEHRGMYWKANGAVFVCGMEEFLKNKDFYFDEMLGYFMPPDRGLDIDTELDYLLALTLVERKGYLTNESALT